MRRSEQVAKERAKEEALSDEGKGKEEAFNEERKGNEEVMHAAKGRRCCQPC